MCVSDDHIADGGQQFDRENLGPLLGYGCGECEEWWARDEHDRPLVEAEDHVQRIHDGDRETIVEVRDEYPFEEGSD